MTERKGRRTAANTPAADEQTPEQTPEQSPEQTADDTAERVGWDDTLSRLTQDELVELIDLATIEYAGRMRKPEVY